jgi:hypothetical protein
VDRRAKARRVGQLDFVNVTVRFFPEVIGFIQEGEKRHKSQKILLDQKLPMENQLLRLQSQTPTAIATRI